MSLHRVLLAGLFAAVVSAPALAQEVVKSGDTGAPPSEPAAAAPQQVGRPASAADENSPEAIGRWAQGILDGKPAEKAADAVDPKGRTRGCAPPADRKPHGEVWAGVGTGGYKEVGGVVTQPIGDCGQVTIAIDKTDFGGRRR